MFLDEEHADEARQLGLGLSLSLIRGQSRSQEVLTVRFLDGNAAVKSDLGSQLDALMAKVRESATASPDAHPFAVEIGVPGLCQMPPSEAQAWMARADQVACWADVLWLSTEHDDPQPANLARPVRTLPIKCRVTTIVLNDVSTCITEYMQPFLAAASSIVALKDGWLRDYPPHMVPRLRRLTVASPAGLNTWLTEFSRAGQGPLTWLQCDGTPFDDALIVPMGAVNATTVIFSEPRVVLDGPPVGMLWGQSASACHVDARVVAVPNEPMSCMLRPDIQLQGTIVIGSLWSGIGMAAELRPEPRPLVVAATVVDLGPVPSYDQVQSQLASRFPNAIVVVVELPSPRGRRGQLYAERLWRASRAATCRLLDDLGYFAQTKVDHPAYSSICGYSFDARLATSSTPVGSARQSLWPLLLAAIVRSQPLEEELVITLLKRLAVDECLAVLQPTNETGQPMVHMQVLT